jgi:hypothetical protein
MKFHFHEESRYWERWGIEAGSFKEACRKFRRRRDEGDSSDDEDNQRLDDGDDPLYRITDDLSLLTGIQQEEDEDE